MVVREGVREADPDVCRGLGFVLGMQEAMVRAGSDPSDEDFYLLGRFIQMGGDLGRALHRTAHNRGPVPEREPWDSWQRFCTGIIDVFESSVSTVMDDPELLERGGHRAREYILGSDGDDTLRTVRPS
jgi:hypothetical protein